MRRPLLIGYSRFIFSRIQVDKSTKVYEYNCSDTVNFGSDFQIESCMNLYRTEFDDDLDDSTMYFTIDSIKLQAFFIDNDESYEYYYAYAEILSPMESLMNSEFWTDGYLFKINSNSSEIEIMIFSDVKGGMRSTIYPMYCSGIYDEDILLLQNFNYNF